METADEIASLEASLAELNKSVYRVLPWKRKQAHALKKRIEALRRDLVEQPDPVEGDPGAPRSEVHEYNLKFFDVVRYDDDTTDIVFQGRRHRVLHSLGASPYTRANTLPEPMTMPTQATGVCYFHAAMHVIMNNRVFAEALVRHLDRQIASNPFARQPGEDAEAASKRRGLARNITMSTEYPLKKAGVRPLLNTINDDDLYTFARNVLLRQTLLVAKKGFFETIGNKNTDSRTLFLTKTLHSLKGRTYERNMSLVEGGHVLNALDQILRLSALQMSFQYGKGLVARIPGEGIALAVTDADVDLENIDRYFPHDMGESYGAFTFVYIGTFFDNGSTVSGHGISYQRADGKFRYVDSNFGNRFPSWEDLKSRYAVKDLLSVRILPSYTIGIDANLVGGAQDEADEELDSEDTLREQLELLSPVEPNALASCDDEVCGLPDDVQFAIDITKQFMDKEAKLAQGGGGSAPYGQWCALAGVIVAMACV